MIVVDTNLVSYLLIEGEFTQNARDVYQHDPDWIVPGLWRAEFLSVLTTTITAGVITPAQGDLLWQRTLSLFGQKEHNPNGRDVLKVALQFQISAYDAQFIAVAKNSGVPLVTSDRQLIKACPPHAQSMHQFLHEQ